MPKAKRTYRLMTPRKIRRTVMSSGFTGVLAAAAAGVLVTPGGINGIVGISAAHPLHRYADEAGSPGFAEGAPPLSNDELRGIRNELDESGASLEAARASTDDQIARIKMLADNPRTWRVATAPTIDSYDDLAALFALSRG